MVTKGKCSDLLSFAGSANVFFFHLFHSVVCLKRRKNSIYHIVLRRIYHYRNWKNLNYKATLCYHSSGGSREYQGLLSTSRKSILFSALPFLKSVPSPCCVHVATVIFAVQFGSWILLAVQKKRVGNHQKVLFTSNTQRGILGNVNYSTLFCYERKKKEKARSELQTNHLVP